MVNLRNFHPSQAVLAAIAFGMAAVLSGLIAYAAALVIENRSAKVVTTRLLGDGITWASVTADGLQVHLSGEAPNEAARYRAVNLAGAEVEASRIRDDLQVAKVRTVAAPRFSVEMLRNDDGIQLIGLLPDGPARDTLSQEAQALSPDIALADMLEVAAYAAPDGWDAAFAFGVNALELLPRSKISVSAGRVEITAIASSAAEKRSFEAELARLRPEGLAVTIEISAPRPVLTPFTLRFVKDAGSARFDACSADTERARSRIIAAGVAAGADPRATCTIGLGVPSPSWAEAAETGIAALDALGAGTITFSDADVTLLADEGVSQASFDRVVGELQTALPPLFSLNATLPRKASAPAQGPAEFTAALAPETGRVEIRGRLADEVQRAAVDSYARARFGTAEVYVATRFDPELPDGWTLRVLAGLEALAELEHGTLLVRADTVQIAGVTGSQNGRARISQILSGKLGQGKTFKVEVSYDERLDPLAALPTPEECEVAVTAVLSLKKITFTPGSAEIDASAGSVMNALAIALTDCTAIKMEIAGHTDAQGSEEGNRALSQARAEAVLLALQGRQVDVSGMLAKGYGESVPIADNGSDIGREANRRIEFSLVGQATKPAETAQSAPLAAGSGADGGRSGGGQSGGGQDAAPTPAPKAASDPAQPDFSADTSPSAAPAAQTARPRSRPAANE